MRTNPRALARRLARVASVVLFAFAILMSSLAPLAASVEAKSRGVAKKSRRARATTTKQSRAKNDARRGGRDGREERETAGERERFDAPGDGEEEGEGDNVQRREDWFTFQRAYPFDAVPDDARRAAYASRPTVKLKAAQLRGALSVDAAQWTPIGPSPTTPKFPSNWGRTSGHVRAVAVKPDDANVVLIGASSGGIWRSTDAGATFAPVSDSQVDLAVSSIAFAPGNTSIVYAGMGGQTGFGSYLGTGVLKSTDAGATWTRVDTAGLSKRGRSVSLAVDPTNPNRVYLCHYIKQPDDTNNSTFSDGFYVSNDGGSTWSQTLAGLPDTVVVSPADPNVLFVSMARVDFDATKPSGVYKSTDKGQTWTNVYSLNVVSPTSKDCYLAVTPADPQRVYVAMRGASTTTLSVAYTTDNGANWTTGPDLSTVDMGQWGYNAYIAANPVNPDTIYLGTRDVWSSTDKGATWTNLTKNFSASGSYNPFASFAHPDQHCFGFAPGDGGTFYIGNDGGLYKTTSGGLAPSGFSAFTQLNTSLTLSQFVGYVAHPTDPNFQVGGTQDNGTQYRVETGNGVGYTEFAEGDGGHPVINPVDPRAVISAYVNGSLRRWLFTTPTSPVEKLGASTNATFGESSSGPRIGFYAPVTSNGVDQTVYFGSYRLFVSPDFANTATVNAPTWNAPGGTFDQTKGGSDVLSAIAPAHTAYSNTQVIYTGSSQGRVMVSQDGGATWADITNNLPVRSITSITVDGTNAAIAYVTVSGFGSGHVWKTANMGQTWTDLSGTTPATKLPNIPTDSLLIDPAPTGLIYVGTDIGVFRSTGDGNWESFNNGLPPVPVPSIVVGATGKLIVGTFGRGAYELNSSSNAGVLRFDSATYSVGEGAGTATVTVTRAGGSTGAVSVNYATSNGTAIAGSDYNATSGTLSFADGETSKTFPVSISQDTLAEGNETVNLTLSSPTNGAILGSPSNAFLTIVDDDTAGTIQFGSAAASVNESAGTATITVTRTGGAASNVSVNYATSNGTATAGSDYTATSGTLTFGANETSKTFNVAITNDALNEANETINLALSSPSGGATLGTPSTAALTITDDDPQPGLSINDVTVNEGNSGTTPATFTVTLSAASGQAVSVNYATANGTATTGGGDYLATSGTVTFNAGETTKPINVFLVGDSTVEPDETFTVNLSNAANATISKSQGTGTIKNDDIIAPDASVQFASSSVTASEASGSAQFVVTRTGNTTGTSTVDVRTLDNSAPVRCDDTATAPGVAFARCDYATTVTTLIFNAGDTQKTVTVPLVNDSFVEPNETVTLALSNSTGATLGAQSTTTLTISSDDAAGAPNPIFNTDFFVRMQYLDFLSREPEQGQPWSGVLNNCPANDTSCDRISVSANFFRSQEFQLKGLFVFHFYKVAFGRMPLYSEIIPDMASVTGTTTIEVQQKKVAYTTAFTQRSEFVNAYGATSNQQFVDTLMNRYGSSLITTPNPATPDDTSIWTRVTLTRADLVNGLNAATLTRAQVLRAIADSDQVGAAEFNSAFVAMQYFGYLRRDPDAVGYQAWLNTINANPSDFRAMVNGFMNSTEYRLRFGTP